MVAQAQAFVANQPLPGMAGVPVTLDSEKLLTVIEVNHHNGKIVYYQNVFDLAASIAYGTMFLDMGYNEGVLRDHDHPERYTAHVRYAFNVTLRLVASDVRERIDFGKVYDYRSTPVPEAR